MKWIIAVVAVGAAVAAVSGGDVPVKTAEVPAVPAAAGGVLGRPGHALGPLCREGHVWKQDCNTCSCLMGRAACTEMACPGGGDGSDSSGSSSSSSEEAADGKCAPGTSWRSDCNSCHCSSTGHAMCTAMACAPSLPRARRSLGSECTPGTTWKKDCNTCTCTGGRAACTLMACLDLGGGGGGGRDNPALRPVPVDNQCAPGTSWNDGCNNCRCTSTGVSICTQRACLHHHKRDVAAGGNGGGRDNPALRPVPVDNQCSPGTSWNDGCNNCRCTSTGVSICTQRACLHHHKRDVADVPEPSEGAPHKGCTPGETWKNDCNNCRCTPDGIPACTKKRCIKPAELEAAAAAGQDRRRRELTEPSEGVPHKGCTPGETWKNDCNNCRCTPSGIPACTKMRCIKPPQPEGN